jgi:dolichyl-phosphooligosaccharide-protein glycotransferase
MIDAAILAAIFVIAICLRVIPQQQNVFGSGWVNFQGPDPWYHVRLIENLLHHFPFRINFDPFTFFPYGQAVWFAPFFDWLIGFFAWIIGGGSPSQTLIYNVAAYFPAILGALVSVPVYFIGRSLFNRWAGLLAALLVAILPGPFLNVTVLGYVDHHAAEILFSTTSIMFLILALKRNKENPVIFDNIRRGQWKIFRKPLIFSILSGVALGLYLLTWVGGLLIVFLFFCWAVIMAIVSHLKHESTDYLGILGVPVFLVALIMVVPFLDQLAFATINILSLVIAIVALLVMSGISRLMASKNINRGFYPAALVVIAVVGLVCIRLVSPSTFGLMLQQFQQFAPSTNLLTINEARPLFFLRGPFSFGAYWGAFTTASFLAPIAFIFLLVLTIRKVEAGKVLLLAWGLLTFVATVGQVRFAEYLTISFAILAAFLIWQVVEWVPAILKYFEFKPRQENRKEKARRKKEQSRLARSQPSAVKTENPQTVSNRGAFRYIYIGIAVILVFFLGIFTNIQPAIGTAGLGSGINKDWYGAMVWMKDNTPEPFPDTNYFNELYQKPANGVYSYPATAYGVMSWWDFGHYITTIAHRIPNSNPNQSGAASAAAYFTAQDATTADKMLDQLGSKYVMIDLDMVTPLDNSFKTRMFADVAAWANTNLSRYCEVYFSQVGQQLQPVTLYYPEYYYTMGARLFNFGGAQVTPTSTTVISFKIDSGYRVIQTSQAFPTYAAAKAFVDGQSSPNWRIVSNSPFVSPVPLDKLDHYQPVYQSQVYQVDQANKISLPYVQIFKYTP